MRRTALIEDEPERFEVAGRGSPRDDLVDGGAAIVRAERRDRRRGNGDGRRWRRRSWGRRRLLLTGGSRPRGAAGGRTTTRGDHPDCRGSDNEPKSALAPPPAPPAPHMDPGEREESVHSRCGRPLRSKFQLVRPRPGPATAPRW